MKKDNYECNIYGKNGYAGKVELSGYSAEFVYKPVDYTNLTAVQKEKFDKLNELLK